MSPPLTCLINFSVNSGYYPEAFNLTLVTPISKTGDKKWIRNYRPNSIPKVFEKILKIRITKYKNIYKTLSY